MCLILAIVDWKVILEKFLGLTDLSEAQALYIHKPTKIILVYKDKYFVLAAFQMMTSCFEGFNNS